uniref:Cyclin-like domain-containing protein n=1 Tax=Zooxanthella nutricula TaxID=1333877 RepID=A0A7S2IJC9_9DINO
MEEPLVQLRECQAMGEADRFAETWRRLLRLDEEDKRTREAEAIVHMTWLLAKEDRDLLLAPNLRVSPELFQAHFLVEQKGEVLFLAVRIISRYRSSVEGSVPRLLLSAAVLIASKFVDVTPPSAYDMLAAIDTPSALEDLLAFEARVLTSIDGRIHVPTAFHYLESFCSKVFGPSPSATGTKLARYLAELGLFVNDWPSWLPSQHAMAAVVLAAVQLRVRVPLEGLTCNEWWRIQAIMTIMMSRLLTRAGHDDRGQAIVTYKHLTTPSGRAADMREGRAVVVVRGPLLARFTLGRSGIRLLPVGTTGIVQEELADGSVVLQAVGLPQERLRVADAAGALESLEFTPLARDVEAMGVRLQELGVQ